MYHFSQNGSINICEHFIFQAHGASGKFRVIQYSFNKRILIANSMNTTLELIFLINLFTIDDYLHKTVHQFDTFVTNMEL
jgi:hypothetical protein